MNALLHRQTGSGIARLTLAWVLPAVIGAIALPPCASARADEGRLATPAELRQMREAGQYRVCLQQIARALRSGSADKQYDRYDLLLARGDCLLHLDDPATALTAYAAAAKSPAPEQAREGRATVLLLQRSPNMTYVPRGGEGGTADGISLASREGRLRALRALLQDELSAGKAEFHRALEAKDLVPIRNVLPRLADLYAVERTATGGDRQLRPILEATGERARTLIDRELGIQEQSIATIDRRANQRVEYPTAAGGWWWGGTVRRGLHTNDRQALRDLIDYLQRVEETARLGRKLAASFDDDTEPWDPLIERSAKAVRSAQDVLDAE
jgi:hypothetical protein